MGKPALGALVSHFHLDQQATNPGQVHQILGTLFGNGAVVLEKLIIRELNMKLNVTLEEGSAFEFQAAVLAARQSLNTNGRKSK